MKEEEEKKNWFKFESHRLVPSSTMYYIYTSSTHTHLYQPTHSLTLTHTQETEFKTRKKKNDGKSFPIYRFEMKLHLIMAAQSNQFLIKITNKKMQIFIHAQMNRHKTIHYYYD